MITTYQIRFTVTSQKAIQIKWKIEEEEEITCIDWNIEECDINYTTRNYT